MEPVIHPRVLAVNPLILQVQSVRCMELSDRKQTKTKKTSTRTGYVAYPYEMDDHQHTLI